MNTRCRFFATLFASLGILISLTPMAHPQTSISRQARTRNPQIQTELSCSPAPCHLPNLQVSQGSTTYAAASNLAINPNNPLQMIAGVEDSACSSGGATYSSGDGGTTWTKSCLPFLNGIYSDGVPAVMYDPHGIVHAVVTLFNLDCGEDPTYETHSSDNGTTWSSLTPVSNIVLYSFSSLGSAVVDNNPGSPFANTIYASIDQYQPSLTVLIALVRSNDGGATWRTTRAAVLPKTVFLLSEGFSHLAVGRDGALYLAYMSTTNGSFAPNDMMFTKSTDGGTTWSDPVLVYSATAVSKIPNTDIFPPDVPVIAVDNSDGPFAGHLYMAFYNWTGAFMQVLATSSSDGGNTWSTPVPVAPPSATHDQFDAGISVSPSGLVSVTWLDRRDDPANLKYRTFLALSGDGGSSFPRNIRLANATSTPTFGLNVAANAWSGSTLYSVWPDKRGGGTLQEFIGGYIP